MKNSSTVIVLSGKNPLENPGGLGSYSISISKSLAAAGYHVKIICFGKFDKNTKVTESIDLIQLRVRFSRLISLGSIIINAQLGKRIVAFLKESPTFNIVAIFGAGIWFRSGIKVKQRLNLKSKLVAAYFTTYSHEFKGHLKGSDMKIFGVFVYLQSLFLFLIAKFIFSPYERNGLKRCDLILTHYDSTKKLIIAELPKVEPKISFARMPNLYMLKHGPVSKATPRIQESGPEINLLLVNRLDPRKGLGLFFLSYKQLLERFPNSRFNCDVVGSGYFKKNYEALVTRLGISESVNFHGYLADPFELVTHKTIYVLASVEEGSSSISLIEAMSKKLPSVVSNIDGMKEDLRDRIDGFLYNPYDPQSFVSAVENYLQNSSLIEEQGASAYNRFKSKFPEILSTSEVEMILK